MKAIIIAAGKSTRTYPLTLTRPKAMLPVANKPIIEHILDSLKGIADEAVIIVGYMKGMIMDRLGSEYKGIRIEYVEQVDQHGTGHALEQARGHVKGRFLCLNGDDLISGKDIKNLVKNDCGALAKKVDDPKRFGVFVKEKEGKGSKVIDLVEKPEDFVSDLANTGCYVLDERIFDYVHCLEKSDRGEIELTEAVANMIKDVDFQVVEIEDFWIPIGYPWNLLEANVHYLKSLKTDIKGDIEEGVSIKGEVVIGKGTLIRNGTSIEGPAIIGDGCIIGPCAYIRPDSAIGNKCHIRSEVYDTVIMDNTKAKHNSYLGHSVIGEGVNIGCGTVTADFRHDGGNNMTLIKGKKIDSGRRKLGAFIGDHVNTAINTSIYPGRKIWPDCGTLPGEVVTKDIADRKFK